MERGETVAQRWPANRVYKPVLQVGGILFLTIQRVVFSPSKVDRFIGYKLVISRHKADRVSGFSKWSSPLTAIRGVSVAPRELTKPSAGGSRRRLSLNCRDETEQLFVVDRIETVAAALTQAISL